MSNKDKEHYKEDCTIPDHPIPPEVLSNYKIDSDWHVERDIINYVEGQAPGETVQHIEKIKKEIIIGETFEIWDVSTDKDRWWVITNLLNLYSHKYFPSLDYTISFHIGLMMRIRSRPDQIVSHEPTPFDEVFRRMDQAEYRHDEAVEIEDFQAVGMLLREALLSLIIAIKNKSNIQPDTNHPQEANYLAWLDLLMNQLCGGGSNKELRQHLKNIGKEAWQLSNWLTHTKSASRTASTVALHTCQTIIGHMLQVVDRERIDAADKCPVCKSKDVRKHFDIDIPPNGDYYLSCGICDWNDHPIQDS